MVTTRRRTILLGIALLPTLGMVASPPRVPRSRQPGCAEAPAAPTKGLSLRGATGVYRVRLVATTGKRAGGVADGELLLEDAEVPWRPWRDSAGQRVDYRMATWGVLSVALAPVGGPVYGMRTRGERVERFLLTGDERRVTQRDSSEHSVHSLWVRPPRHPRDEVLGDERQMHLEVTARLPGQVLGRWSSAPHYEDATTGYFCARRVAP